MNSRILTPSSKSTTILRFNKLTIEENGLIVKNKKNEEMSILYSEINMVYIKKRKLSLPSKIAFIMLLLMLLASLSIFLPIEFLMLSSILCIPLIAKMNTYKWYEFNLQIKDRKLYVKVFYLRTKQEHINFVNQVRNQLFECQIKSNLQYQNAYFEEEITNKYSHSILSSA